MATAVVGTGSAWADELVVVGRRFAGISAAGAVAGVVVGGVGGRLAMLLLARLNPAATGVTSDDGFRMGQFTLSGSLSLMSAGLFLGLLAALFYAVLRHLMIGPLWFRRLSISLGPAVVVGAQLVHTDGVDFTLLGPLWLTVGLFVAIPGLAVLLLTVLAERWIAPDAWTARAPLWAVAPVLLLWGPALVAVVALAIAWSLRWLVRRDPRIGPRLDHPATGWVARGGLTVVFVLSAVTLVRDVVTLA